MFHASNDFGFFFFSSNAFSQVSTSSTISNAPSSPLEASTGPLNGLGGRVGASHASNAPQKPFNFAALPTELKTPVANALEGKDRRSFALASRQLNAVAQPALASEQAVYQIKNMPMSGLNDLNAALQLAKGVLPDLRHEPLQAVADKLVFLPRQDWQAGKDIFMQQAKPSVKEGSSLDQSLKFVDWAISAETVDQPNMPDYGISSRQVIIEGKMRDGLSAREAAVEFVVNSIWRVNDHDIGLLVQHAQNFRP